MNRRKLALLLLSASLLLALAYAFDLRAALEELLAIVQRYPRAGPLLFIAAYVVSCVLLLPGFLLTGAAGLTLGVPKGFGCVSVGATVGASCAFLLSRYVLRTYVEEYVKAHPKAKALDGALAEEGVKVVFLSRLCPLIPFRISNYVFGVTSISFRRFLLATWLGTMPSAFVYVYLGSLAASIDDLSRQPQQPWVWALYAASGIVLLVFLWYISRLAQRAMERQLAQAEEESAARTAKSGRKRKNAPIKKQPPSQQNGRRSRNAATVRAKQL